jgi:spore germination cell wall hydrolase CwlJ-like protein
VQGRGLLVAVAFVFSAGALPLFEDGAYLCPAPGGFAGGTRQTPPTYNLVERDYLIKTIAFEAPNESDRGKAAVAYVILNRKKSGRWADNVKDVVMQPWQFEPWMTRRKEMENLSPNDPRYRDAARIADAVLSGDISDPTAGATHFLNPVVVRQRRGGSLPSWAAGGGHAIGRHTFYAPDEPAGAVHWAGLSFGGIVRLIFTPSAC